MFNLYCDESCHLEHDNQEVMVLGCICCESNYTREAFEYLRELKKQNGLSTHFEAKWTKVSPGQINYYKQLIDYFFKSHYLSFRAVIIPNKSKLNHYKFHQDHDTWYYKMYFILLSVLLNPNEVYNIYLDKKDTRSEIKVRKLHDVLCNNMYDFDRQIINKVQTVQSHEIELLQLCDLMIGAISYVNRKLTTSNAKIELIEKIKELSHYSLERSTLLRETKFNIFKWHAGE